MLIINFNTFPIIETERLLLREITLQDASDLFTIRSNTDAMKYIDRPIAKTIEDAVVLIDKMIDLYTNNEGISWAICLKEDAKLIGTIGFWRIDKPNYRAEIGYMLEPKLHRKGIMNEAFTPTIHYAFNEMNLHSIEANINVENLASRKILEKNGFVQEAHFKENYFYNGKFLDSVILSLLNKN
jgi:[ribosomal protein S5]-alanine N-acetyltransferase